MGERKQTLSIVVPVYNEEAVLESFHSRISAVLNAIDFEVEIIYVNDGSKDRTLKIMEHLQYTDRRVTIVDLSRNYGKEIALTAGLDHAKSDAVVVIDADLQDPPDLIPDLIDIWVKGFDVVYAKRLTREGDSWLKKTTAYIFYRLMQTSGRVKIPEDTGDFRLLSRRAVMALLQLREQHRFMKGLFTWIGFPQTSVLYKRDSRYAGKTKWNYWQLWNLAVEGITSFTTAPLRMATYIGLFTAIGAFLFALHVVYKTIVYGNPVAGYPSLLVVVLFLGGVQLMAIGVMGEYLGRIFNETKQRPLYFLNMYRPSKFSKPL